MTKKERWEIARGLIQHEDQLTNHRYTWFLSLQGFLFASFGVVTGALASGKSGVFAFLLHVILVIVPIFGGTATFLIMPAMKGAIRHLRATTAWWEMYGRLSDKEWESLPESRQFPVIKHSPKLMNEMYANNGYDFKALNKRPSFGPYWVQYFVITIWSIILLLVISVWIYEAGSSVTEPLHPGHTFKLEYTSKD